MSGPRPATRTLHTFLKQTIKRSFEEKNKNPSLRFHFTLVSSSDTSTDNVRKGQSAPPSGQPPSGSPTPQEHMGPKRGRFLMRQPRIKRDSDFGQEGELEMGLSQYLTLPPVRIERQCSEPIRPVSPSPESLPEHALVKQHSHPLLPSKTNENTTRSSHCPVVRAGPALGCNYCWNTVDNHGRILRRKTKYHCPECQTNLCIVPCFQEYHKCQVEKSANPESLLPPPVTKLFPKSSS